MKPNTVLIKDLICDSLWIPNSKSSADEPKISILLPTFQRFKSGFFRNSVDSILNQTLRDFELIIIDDCSTDGTFDEIKNIMEKDHRVNCIRHQKNIGLPAVSIYEGFLKSRAEVIGFAFDDNVFRPEAFDLQLKFLERCDSKICFGYVTMQYLENHKIKSVPLGMNPPAISSLLSHNYIPNNAVIAKRSVFETVGWYDPHILMARVCDWDMWRRIAQSFEITYSDVNVGTEMGPTLSDSLGSSYKLNLWAVEDWMRQPMRSQHLSLEHYLNYNVIATPSGISSITKEIIAELKWHFRKKTWAKNDFKTYASKNSRVLVVAPDEIDASVLLTFDGLSEATNCRLRIIKASSWTWEEVIEATLVIIIRNLTGTAQKQMTHCCLDLGIPIYFYVDDNFTLLAEQAPHQYGEYSEDKLPHLLEKFSGILVSTTSLKDYFQLKNIHHSIDVIPPIRKSIKAERCNSKIPCFAFIGGSHRYNTFDSFVLPALRELAINQPLRLITFGMKKSDYNLENNFQWHNFPFEHDYDSVLRKLSYEKVHVLIHPSSEHPNNKFKTLNACINADILNAVAVVSNTEPYSSCQVQAFLKADNSVDSWTFALRQAIDDETRQSVLKENSVFCKTHYSGHLNHDVLVRLIEKHQTIGIDLVTQRYRKIVRQCSAYQPSLSVRFFNQVKSLVKSILFRTNFGISIFRVLRQLHKKQGSNYQIK